MSYQVSYMCFVLQKHVNRSFSHICKHFSFMDMTTPVAAIHILIEGWLDCNCLQLQYTFKMSATLRIV